MSPKRPASEIGGETRSCELLFSYAPSRSVLKQPVPSAQLDSPARAVGLRGRGGTALPFVGGAGVREAVLVALEPGGEHGLGRALLGPGAEDQVRSRELSDVLVRVVAEREGPRPRRLLAREPAQPVAHVGLDADPLRHLIEGPHGRVVVERGQHVREGPGCRRADVVEHGDPIAGGRLQHGVEVGHEGVREVEPERDVVDRRGVGDVDREARGSSDLRSRPPTTRSSRCDSCARPRGSR